jgi:Spy/CpxP family protein refolding chaperone
MKKSLVSILFCATLSAGLAIAAPQDANQPPTQEGTRPNGPGPGRRGMMMNPERQADMLSKRLKLSDEQKSKLVPVLTDQQKQFKALQDDSSMSREDRFAKMKSIRDESENKIMDILTDDQKAQYTKMKEERQQHMRERMMGRDPNKQDNSAPNQ